MAADGGRAQPVNPTEPGGVRQERAWGRLGHQRRQRELLPELAKSRLQPGTAVNLLVKKHSPHSLLEEGLRAEFDERDTNDHPSERRQNRGRWTSLTTDRQTPHFV